MGIKSISMPQRVAINRPFLYTIYDNKTKMILFMGVQSFKNVKE
jgi:serine protease inhibitor